MTSAWQSPTHPACAQAALTLPLQAPAQGPPFSRHRSFDRRGSSDRRGTGPEKVMEHPAVDSRPPFGLAAYGQAAAQSCNLSATPIVATRTLKMAQLSATRLTSSIGGTELPSLRAAERAYLIVHQLRDSPGAKLRKAGRPVVCAPFSAGSVTIADLGDEPSLYLPDAFDILLFHVPKIAFDELADAHGAPRISALNDQVGVPDVVVHSLAQALLPCLEPSQSSPPLFFDHVVFAIYARLASQYGELRHGVAEGAGGLTPRQERLAKAALAANLAQDPSLPDVARACGLSVSRFIRGFRRTTGMPPHRWLRAARVERAREMLLNTKLALAQIAYECGFSDQSHFTRVFMTAVGTTPGAWRRASQG
jgi:AraC family transcriptional regulator